ncbi:MAG: methylated DNA-protein cysteine methyltransferase, partial [Alphaproteobacteria bacterium]
MAKKSAIDHVQDTKKQVKIVQSLPDGIKWAHEGASMVVSTPMEVDQLMATVPKGKLTTSDRLRANLAQKHKTDYACPMSTGIFINISSKAATERLEMGADLTEVTPYWRTLKTGGELNPKFPGGLEGHATKLEAEDHVIHRK